MSIRFICSRTTLALVLPLTALYARAQCSPPAGVDEKLRSTPNVAAYSELGGWFMNRHQYDCASEAYRKAWNLQPGSSRLSYLVGLSLVSAGHPDDAILPLENAIKVAPNALKPRLLLASAFEQAQRDAEAKAQWQAAVKIDPESTAALDGLSKVLIKEGQAADVLELLGTKPRDENLAIDRAEAYMALKRQQDATTFLTAALDQHPQSMAIGNMLTRVEIQQFHYQAAEKIAEKTANLYPGDFETQRLYLRALVLAGNMPIARPLAQKLLTQAPQDSDLLYISGVLDHDAGDLRAARTHLEQAVAAKPDSFAARYNLGQVLAQLNNPRGAKEQLEKALELGATEPEVHLELAKALRALGETQAATEQFQLYQTGLKQQHDRALAASKTAQGDTALAAKDAEKAAGFYREALEATPEDPQLNYKLAVALDLRGDTPGERAALEKAIEINPNLAVAQNQLGFLDSKSGDSAEAEKHFREAVRAAPEFTEAWVNLAATLGLESRFTEAQQAVTSALQLDPKNPQALLLRDTLAKALAQH